MSPLLKIRSERDHMSAIERRIADFLLDNAYLLRDYSSQQLASALGISQSSVVKFSQKLGFKGYRSEEHTSELQSLMRISYAVFCLKNKTKTQNTQTYKKHKTHMIQ